MKYLLIIPLILLQGCYQSVDNNDIQTAIQICGSVEKIVHIDANMVGGETVMCTDRRTVWMPTRAADR